MLDLTFALISTVDLKPLLLFRHPVSPTWIGAKISSYSFTVTAPLWTCPVCMFWKENVHVKKKRHCLTSLSSWFVQFVSWLYFLIIQIHSVSVSGRGENTQAWITLYVRTTKLETRFFLREEILEWLNPSLPDLLLDCLTHSNFDCTYRFCMNIH